MSASVDSQISPYLGIFQLNGHPNWEEYMGDVEMQGSGSRGDVCRVVARPAASANRHATSTRVSPPGPCIVPERDLRVLVLQA